MKIYSTKGVTPEKSGQANRDATTIFAGNQKTFIKAMLCCKIFLKITLKGNLSTGQPLFCG
ncbi:hypothetical protein [Parafilimonas sp.]|uniref:hypothetical protein n=1 Tax=Parafilimonas sp. TaxID=1969739 RepID=UPI0039E564A0